MNRAILGALLAALITATLSACSSDDDDGGGSTAPTETVTVEAEADPLVLRTDNIRTTHCWDDEPPGELAWYDVQWRAGVDLEEFSFSLTGAEGVRLVGAPKTVPPVNFGGRIDYSGTSTWEPHKRLIRRANAVNGFNLDSVDFWSPLAGETGLLVMHLRFDPDALASAAGARLGGVSAAYTTADGETGEASVDTRNVFRTGKRCKGS